jgi:mannose-6-phosphate isomerase
MIDCWQNKKKQIDNNFPEEWVASIVRARNSEREHMENEGLSMVYTDNGNTMPLIEIIESNPVKCLGKKHYEKFGTSTAVLVKFLDAAERLTIQVHPDQSAAWDYFNSTFGKTEAWYILGGRKVNGEPPYILLEEY